MSGGDRDWLPKIVYTKKKKDVSAPIKAGGAKKMWGGNLTWLTGVGDAAGAVGGKAPEEGRMNGTTIVRNGSTGKGTRKRFVSTASTRITSRHDAPVKSRRHLLTILLYLTVMTVSFIASSRMISAYEAHRRRQFDNLNFITVDDGMIIDFVAKKPADGRHGRGGVSPPPSVQAAADDRLSNTESSNKTESAAMRPEGQTQLRDDEREPVRAEPGAESPRQKDAERRSQREPPSSSVTEQGAEKKTPGDPPASLHTAATLTTTTTSSSATSAQAGAPDGSAPVNISTSPLHLIASFEPSSSKPGALYRPVTWGVPTDRLRLEDWRRDEQRARPTIRRRRKVGPVDFAYEVPKEFAERYCPTPDGGNANGWDGIYYMKTFESECVANGDESDPLVNTMRDLMTSWHRIERPVKYRDTRTVYVEMAVGGRANPMHLLHNNLFPFAFIHLACFTGDEPQLALLPANMDKTEWLDLFVRRLFATLFGAENVLEIRDNPDLWCFKELTYIRGAYKQMNPGPFLGMECPVKLEDEPAMQRECDALARTTVQFFSTVMRTFLDAQVDEDRTNKRHNLKDPQRPVNVYVYDRMEQSTRRWENADAAIRALKKLDNVNVQYIPSFRVPLSVQCRYFYEADVFIMPHGGALANALCSRRHTAIVEMMKKCYTHDEWWLHAIEDAMEIDHIYLQCVRLKKGQEIEHTAEGVVVDAVRQLLPTIRSAMAIKDR